MDSHKWAPITDADLLEPEEVESSAPPPLPESYPPRPAPIYTYADWKIFNYWLTQRGFSLDQAAECAGIRVYDALVTLEERSPWLYEFMVMVSPQSKSGLSTRRRRGTPGSLGGQAKNYARMEKLKPRDKPPTEKEARQEEARRQFLEMTAEQHPDDEERAIVHFHSIRCGWCHKPGHKINDCPELVDEVLPPAGSNNPPNDTREGYEESATKRESA